MRFATSLTLLTLTLTVTVAAGTARADDVAVDPTATATPAPVSEPLPEAADPDKIEYGVDLRIRQVFLPAGLMGLFVEHAAGGASNTGIGVDFVRRRGNVELQLGFEYEHINLAEGVYINKGDNVANGDGADYILNPDHAGTNFGWFSIEFTFINHVVINKYVSFRYGGGAGIGILSGSVKRVDTACAAGATNDNPEPGCVPVGYTGPSGKPGTGTVSPDNPGDPEPNPYNLPPVFPVINAIVGFQFHPVDKVVINLEGGIRTLPFIGLSLGYFF